MDKDYSKIALEQHAKLKGKIKTKLADSLDDKDKLSIYYTPGVAAVSSEASKGREIAREYTWLSNSVAVISDGTAVLGLGNIGPYGALPVMEGKCMLFKHFADIDAVPIVLDVHSADEIVSAVKAIAPSFGGINLEDISAPLCFEIEERLKDELDIPVFHDDQHGTAIVVLAGLINAAKVVGKKLNECKIVVIGAGAAGTAIINLINKHSAPNILAIDSKGIISSSRSDLNEEKKKLLDVTNKFDVSGDLADAVKDADIFIGVSKPGLLTKDMIKSMSDKPIVFALSNPTPEIMPDEAHEAGAVVVATGRSDFPNQVNNALVFPGVFRGALDNRINKITDDHKIAVAEKLASLVKNPTASKIIPSIQEPNLASRIAAVIV